MDKVIWHLRSAGGVELVGSLWLPLVVGLTLYYSSYLPILVRALARKASAPRPLPALDPGVGHDLLVVLPTLLRRRDELLGLQRAITSILDNGYPGHLVVCPAIDHAAYAPHLVRDLEAWLARRRPRADVTILIATRDARGGKAMAVEAGVAAVHAAVARGELAAFPTIFVNMDADSELGDHALRLLAARLTRRGRLSRRRPMIVASNVTVGKEVYWHGWRGFFTVRGQLALQVAREYLTSISLARNNWRVIPVSGVSGALYCTWSELYLAGPRYAGFVGTLRRRDWVRWWLGGGAPSLARSTAAPVPEAMTGPGDDTWMAWLALSARWRAGRICLELPRTPLHALVELIRSYVFRPIAYAADARVFTSTPTTIRALFKQRVRWNSSRIWLLHRFRGSMWFHWSAGAVVYLDAAIVLVMHGMILAGLLLWPLAERPQQWLAMLLIANVAYGIVRAGATLLAMIQDDDVRGQWHKLLALPLSGLFHLVFNILTTAVGLVQDLLLFGVNTGFSPEETLIRAGTGRVALAYRVRRAALLTVRSAIHGDVPFGRFWFGWGETPWTPDGYRGWTDPRARRPAVALRRRRRR
ncbi:MAG: hypothetical protein H6709_13600 [Kofleriaceae bacterium]|nr:hypothetical protein [Kofleriaceae bacterium]MCB9573113.1 hypothetical protein [Kofleriaceae bacterium]